MTIAVAIALAASAMGLDQAAAQAAIAGCVAHAAGKRQSHAIVVVDAGGRLVAALRMDGNAYGIMDFAQAKAEAVAAWGFSTTGMAGAARDTPAFAQAPHVVTVTGGVPLFTSDRRFVGAIGVSGEAPADDGACAEAAAAAAGLLTSRPRP